MCDSEHKWIGVAFVCMIVGDDSCRCEKSGRRQANDRFVSDIFNLRVNTMDVVLRKVRSGRECKPLSMGSDKGSSVRNENAIRLQ